MSFTTKSKISDLKIIVCDKKNQNASCTKAIKVEQIYLNEKNSTKYNNSNEKNKGMNLKQVIKLYDYNAIKLFTDIQTKDEKLQSFYDNEVVHLKLVVRFIPIYCFN